MFVQTLTCFGFSMKWLPMTSLFCDKAASPVLDKATLWRLWLGLYLFLSWFLILRPLILTGDDQHGYNIPQIRACPELGDFLSQPEEELARANPSQAPELVRRLLCDSYMFLYQNPAKPLSKPDHQES